MTAQQKTSAASRQRPLENSMQRPDFSGA